MKGVFELSDNMNNRFFAVSIGLVSDWRKAGPVWEIPFGMLVAPHTENLFAAGRCISSAGDAWEITRCIPCACLTGEAAGCAVALRCGTEGDLTSHVQKQMEKNGSILHWRILKEAGSRSGEQLPAERKGRSFGYWTWIRCTLARSDFGRVTVSTPSWVLAEMFSTSTASESWNERL